MRGTGCCKPSFRRHGGRPRRPERCGNRRRWTPCRCPGRNNGAGPRTRQSCRPPPASLSPADQRHAVQKGHRKRRRRPATRVVRPPTYSTGNSQRPTSASARRAPWNPTTPKSFVLAKCPETRASPPRLVHIEVVVQEGHHLSSSLPPTLVHRLRHTFVLTVDDQPAIGGRKEWADHEGLDPVRIPVRTAVVHDHQFDAQRAQPITPAPNILT